MARSVRTAGPAVRTADHRTVRIKPKAADPELQTKAHQAWRLQVLRMAGHRCQAVENGQRCTVAAPARLFADHIVERRDGGAPLDVANGRAVCGRHHNLKTAAERAKRMAARPV